MFSALVKNGGKNHATRRAKRKYQKPVYGNLLILDVNFLNTVTLQSFIQKMLTNLDGNMKIFSFLNSVFGDGNTEIWILRQRQNLALR